MAHPGDPIQVWLRYQIENGKFEGLRFYGENVFRVPWNTQLEHGEKLLLQVRKTKVGLTLFIFSTIQLLTCK